MLKLKLNPLNVCGLLYISYALIKQEYYLKFFHSFPHFNSVSSMHATLGTANLWGSWEGLFVFTTMQNFKAHVLVSFLLLR